MRRWTKETTKRAVRTFLQAFVAYLAAGLPLLDWNDTSALKATGIGLLISAVAAGIAGVMNLEYVPNGKPIWAEEQEPKPPQTEVGDE